MKLLKLIPAAAIALTTFGTLDAFADSNSKQNSTYSLYCAGNSGNKWYHNSSKSSDRHYHSCDGKKYKATGNLTKGDPTGSSGSTYFYCSGINAEGAENGTCSKN